MRIIAETGYIQVHAFVSNARIPLQNLPVAITDTSGNAIALRLTNRSGTFDKPVAISVPDLSASQSPDTGVIPYSAVNLYARYENFEEIFIENLQVFAGIITDQDLEMIPLSEFPESWNTSETFDTSTQNL